MVTANKQQLIYKPKQLLTMKKLFALLALVLGVVSCQTEPEGFDVVVGGEQEVMLNVSLPEATRANSAEGFDFNNLNGHSIRYILEIEYKGYVVREVQVSKSTTATFPVRLAPDRDYQFTVWADLVTATSVDKAEWYETDLYYNTKDGLSNITFKTNTNTNTNTWTPNTEARDAWTDTKSFRFGEDNLEMTLTRPFAKVRVVATDIAEIRKFGIEPTSAEVEYTTSMFTAFNAVDGEVAGSAEAKTISFNYENVDSYENEGSEQLTLLADYIFVPAENIIKFTLDVNGSDDQLIKSNTFNTQIPVERNKVTSIVGNVLTQGDDIKVSVDNAFENKDEINEPPFYVEIWDGESVSEPSVSEENRNIYEIEKPSELAWLAAAVSGTLPADTRANVPADSFAGKTFILINDVDLGGNEWTPIGMGGKHFEGTFDGNGKTIKGLRVAKRHAKSQAALFCSLAGNAVIKNVVIDEAYIKYPKDSDDFYASAIAGTIYGTVKFENILVKNSTITGNNKIGAIFAHDGSSTQITVNNCHVDNCYIASEDTEDGGNVGGLIGLYQTGSTNACKISNSSVKNSTIVGINSQNNGKRANSEFIGGILTKTNTNLVLENCVVENNRFSQTINGTDAVTYVGAFNPQFIGGDRDEKVLGKVTINGRDDVYVDSAAEFQDALNRVVNGNNHIIFANDIVGDATVYQVENANVIVDGNSKKYNGTISIEGNNRGTGAETLLVKNVKFETEYNAEKVSKYFILGLTDGNSYPHNITIEGCTFENTTAEEGNNYTVAGMSFNQFYNLKVVNCESTNLHSLLQAQSCDNTVAVDGVTITGKNGVSFGNTMNATIKNSTINAIGYGVRADATDAREVSLTVENCDIDAYIPVVARKLNNTNVKKFNLTIGGENTFVGDTKYQIALGANEYEAGVEPVAPVSEYTLNGTEGYVIFPEQPVAMVGSTVYTNIDEAIAAWTNNTTLTLVANVTLKDVITLKSTEHHILDLGTYTMTAAEGKNAFEILPMGVGTAARQCLTINAHTDNPGGITATGKSCIYYHNSEKISDRMTITINGGVFNGSYAINQLTGPTNNFGFVNSPLRGQGAAYCVINGGTFNAQVFINAGMLKVTGGVFHKNLTCYGDSTAYRLISGGRIKSMTMTADAEGKFTIGSNKSTYDVGCYVDDEGYLVVGGPVITEFGDKFAAKATNYSKWSSYLQYSSAAKYGLYYTNAAAAIAKHGEANVVLK